MMRGTTCARLARLLGATLLMTGCSSMNSMLGGNSSTQALAGLKWDYAEHAIGLTWRASARLNAYEGEPHAVTVLVVQMSDPNVFRKVTATPAQVSQLLLETTPPAGVLDMRRFFVQPGQNGQTWFARAQGAQYVGIAVGYYTLQPNTTVRLFKIGVQVKSSGWVAKKRSASPETLAVTLDLGDSGLMGGQPGGPTAPAVPKAANSKALSLAPAAAAVSSLVTPSLPTPPDNLPPVPDADGSSLGSDAAELLHLAPMPASAPHL